MNGWRDSLEAIFADHLRIKFANPVKRLGQDAEDIVMGDLQDIRSCSAMIAYLPDDQQCRGTSVEIFAAARLFQIPIIGFGFGKNASPWNQHFLSVRLMNLQAVVAVLNDRWREFSYR